MAFFDKKDKSKPEEKSKSKGFSFGSLSKGIGSFKPKDSIEPEPDGDELPNMEEPDGDEVKETTESSSPSVDANFTCDDWACINCSHFSPDPSPGKCKLNVKNSDYSKCDPSISRCSKYSSTTEATPDEPTPPMA